MSSCFDCGAPVAPEDRFCGNCGLALRPAPSAGGSAALAHDSSAGESAPVSEPSDAAGRADASAPEAPEGEPEEDLQPTLIESAHVGQAAAAAAAARAPESQDD